MHEILWHWSNPSGEGTFGIIVAYSVRHFSGQVRDVVIQLKICEIVSHRPSLMTEKDWGGRSPGTVDVVFLLFSIFFLTWAPVIMGKGVEKVLGISSSLSGEYSELMELKNSANSSAKSRSEAVGLRERMSHASGSQPLRTALTQRWKFLHPFLNLSLALRYWPFFSFLTHFQVFLFSLFQACDLPCFLKMRLLFFISLLMSSFIQGGSVVFLLLFFFSKHTSVAMSKFCAGRPLSLMVHWLDIPRTSHNLQSTV